MEPPTEFVAPEAAYTSGDAGPRLGTVVRSASHPRPTRLTSLCGITFQHYSLNTIEFHFSLYLSRSMMRSVEFSGSESGCRTPEGWPMSEDEEYTPPHGQNKQDSDTESEEGGRRRGKRRGPSWGPRRRRQGLSARERNLRRLEFLDAECSEESGGREELEQNNNSLYQANLEPA
ncbi:unnamed protein product [Nezara viridula]|uniref:Uncharacterized protein n=1 Tax=Nezara viridula TaxID=85310 RepID=A0A9P0GZ84_NEZVI|nr:unnamed protein product [Nezara viridula]